VARRRAQLVDCIADQFGAALFGCLESGGDGVEARPEFAELILAAGHDSLGVLAVRDAMTGMSQLADWADDAVAHHKTGTDSRRERGHTRQ
jgi:hypothetical protein